MTVAGRNMALDVLVRLRDHLSGPLRTLRNNLSRLVGFARSIGAIGVAVSAISFLGPIQEAAAFQQKLLDIAGTSELVGQRAFTFVDQSRLRYEGLALRIGQFSETIAEGAGLMVAAGVNPAIVDRTIADIGRATTAANANFADMSNVGVAMLNNLKLPANEMRDSLGALVVAGKLGSFELKDMAASFPGLTSGVAKFGVKGREAVNFLGAALQIARKGTSDPSSAANNLSNFLDKALAPLTKKNFAAHGVDIEAVMMDAAAKGINPIEAVVQKIGKLTGVNETQIAKFMKLAKKNGLEGADALGYVREQLEAIGAAGKVGELFQDKQVLDFLVPFLANIEEYKSIKAKVAAATGAITDADFDTQMEGINRQLAIFREVGIQATRDVGFAFAEWLPQINAGLIAALAWTRDLDRSTGGLVKKTIAFAGAGLVLVAAIGALGFALPVVAAGLGAIGALLGVLVSPIGLVVAALAGAGVYIWKNWDRYGGRVMRLWERAKGAFQRLSSFVVDKGRGMVDAGRRLAERYGPAIAASLVRGWQTVADLGGRFGSAIAAGIKAGWAAVLDIAGRFGPAVGRAIEQGWQAAIDVGRRYGPMLRDQLATLRDFLGEIGNVVAVRLPDMEAVKAGGLAVLAGALERLVAVRDGAVNFFKAFSKGFDEAFRSADFSAASVAAGALDALGAALDGLKAVGSIQLDVLKGVFSTVESFIAGIGSHLGGIGENLGGGVAETIKLFRTLGGIVGDLAGLMKLPDLPGGEMAKMAGDLAGTIGDRIGAGIELYLDYSRKALEAINNVAGGIRTITDALASGKAVDWSALLPGWVIWTASLIGGAVDWVVDKVDALLNLLRGAAPDWSLLLPAGVIDLANKIAAGVNAIAGAIGAVKAALSGFSWPSFSTPAGTILPNGTPAGDPNKTGPSGMPEDRERSLDDLLKPPVVFPPQKQSSLTPAQPIRLALADDVIRPAAVKLPPAPLKQSPVAPPVRLALSEDVIRPVVIKLPPQPAVKPQRPALQPAAAPQPRQFAAAVPRDGPVPKARLEGQVGVTVKVEGPGKVTQVASNNPAIVPTGRMVGRV